MLIYISHPFSGKMENQEEVERIVNKLIEIAPEHTYISALHAFGYLYQTTDYEYGLNMCLNLLDVCDKMLVFGDWKSSRGCTAEVLYCQEKHIPYEVARWMA